MRDVLSRLLAIHFTLSGEGASSARPNLPRISELSLSRHFVLKLKSLQGHLPCFTTTIHIPVRSRRNRLLELESTIYLFVYLSSMAKDEEEHEKHQQPPPKPNPFIKFKNHVDDSVSSILQGLIGLPSALSRNSQTRWADLDEELRRRDELQARQAQLKSSEARRDIRPETQDIYGARQEGVSHRGDQWEVIQPKHQTQSTSDIDPANSARQPGTWGAVPPLDIPFYSPYWALYTTGSRHPLDSLNVGIRWNSKVPWPPRPDEMIAPTIMDGFQATSTLVPYLLFSPYSPLKLDSEQNTTNYREAFEDLLKSSRGEPMSNPVFPVRNRQNKTPFGIDWLLHLNALKLLQPSISKPSVNTIADDAQTEQDMYDRFFRGVPLLETDATAHARSFLEELKSLQLDGENALQSLAEEFFGPGAARHMRSVFDELKSFRPEGEKALRDLVDQVYVETMSLAEELSTEFPKFLELKIKAAREEAEREYKRSHDDGFEFPSMNVKEVEERASQQYLKATKFTTGQAAAGGGGNDVSDDQNNQIPVPARQELEAARYYRGPNEKPVYTRTISEHGVNEDGCVEHSVEVWKLYADGRETTTKTSHTEDPAAWDEDAKFESQAQAATSSLQSEENKLAKKTTTMEKKSEKRGWFWN